MRISDWSSDVCSSDLSCGYAWTRWNAVPSPELPWSPCGCVASFACVPRRRPGLGFFFRTGTPAFAGEQSVRRKRKKPRVSLLENAASAYKKPQPINELAPLRDCRHCSAGPWGGADRKMVVEGKNV